MPYRSLDSNRILETAERLEKRIGERFPEAGLRKVAAEVVMLAKNSAMQTRSLEQPIWWLRAATVGAIAAGAAVFVFIGSFVTFDRVERLDLGAVQGIEALVNTLILGGLGLVTLVRLEERIQQKRAFKGLHALRSVIHVIDMHQLTKDPSTYSKGFKKTANSPERAMSRADLGRYLDYCSELLSLTGKLAALYAQALDDAVVVDAVNDIETLATNLSHKIWQKITLLEAR